MKRNKSLRPVGIRFARQKPFMKAGKIDESRLKNFWEDLTEKEKGVAVMFGGSTKQEWKDLSKKDKTQLIEYEKRVTDPKPDTKNELIKRGIVPLFQVKKISEKEAKGFLQNDNEINQIEEDLQQKVENNFDYTLLQNGLDEAEIEEDMDEKGLFVRRINTGTIDDIIESPDDEEPETTQFKTDTLLDKFNEQLQRRFGIGQVYATLDFGELLVEQRLDPAVLEDNKILISKGILRKKRD